MASFSTTIGPSTTQSTFEINHDLGPNVIVAVYDENGLEVGINIKVTSAAVTISASNAINQTLRVVVIA